MAAREVTCQQGDTFTVNGSPPLPYRLPCGHPAAPARPLYAVPKPGPIGEHATATGAAGQIIGVR